MKNAAGVRKIRAKLATRRFDPKTERQAHVWWDRQAHRYMGCVEEMRPHPGWGPPTGWGWGYTWDDEATLIHIVEADSIPQLVDAMRPYADVEDGAQRYLLEGTPPRYRQSDAPAENPRSPH